MNDYIFESKRLAFREFTNTDLEFITKMNAKDTVMAYFPNKLNKTQSEDLLQKMTLHFDNHGYGLYAVVIKESKQLIGFIGFQIATFYATFTPCVEIGWRLDDDYWNKGYATEGAKAVLNYGFNHLNLQKVYSFTAKVNKASIHVMKKIGLIYQEDFNHPKIDSNSDLKKHVLYKITKEEYDNDY